jgi:hypothetical protein
MAHERFNVFKAFNLTIPRVTLFGDGQRGRFRQT